MPTQPQNLSREMAHDCLTGTAAIAALHPSRILYKFALLCKTNPICQQPNSRNRSSTNNLRKSVPLRPRKKQTQNKPNFLIAKMDASHLPTKAYENKPPLRPPAKQTQFIAAKSKRSADPCGWASRNPQTGDQTERPCRGEVLYEAGLPKPDQTPHAEPLVKQEGHFLS